MRRTLIVVVALAMSAGCSWFASEDTKVHEDQAAEAAAVKRMVVTQGADIPGHAKYTELGRVEGVCARPPSYEDAPSSVKPGLRHAAYDKYQDQVDAIINVDSFFVVGNEATGAWEPGSNEGHFECRGIAVHFTQ